MSQNDNEEISNEIEIDTQNNDSQDVVVDDKNETEVEESLEDKEKSKEKEYYERLLYLTAEFDNYKKRVKKEKAEYVQFATERLIKEIVPILDNFERAFEGAKPTKDNKAVLDGIKLIYNQLSALLLKQGVKSVDSVGKPFDPLIHEAISHVPTAEYEPNTVIAEQVKAYFLGKKLIRAASVVVSKAKEESKPEKEEEMKEEKEKQTENSDNS